MLNGSYEKLFEGKAIEMLWACFLKVFDLSMARIDGKNVEFVIGFEAEGGGKNVKRFKVNSSTIFTAINLI